jgi:hypothetical protein
MPALKSYIFTAITVDKLIYREHFEVPAHVPPRRCVDMALADLEEIGLTVFHWYIRGTHYSDSSGSRVC